MSKVSTLPMSVLKVAQVFTIIFAMLMVYAVLPARAQAASLTSSQLQAVVGLLKSFNVDTETIGAIEAQLQDSASTKPKPRPSADYRPQNETDQPGAAICAELKRRLKKGDHGDDVKQLQQRLLESGDLQNASTTGFFGEKTEMALERWQEAKGIVSEGDSESTGYGALGPRSMRFMAAHCKDRLTNIGPHGTNNNYGSSTPTCVLRASKPKIAAGETVVLKWESKYATWASTGSGDKGPTQGYITLIPSETTTYIKTVYNENGSGECTTTVEVEGTVPVAEKKVVIVPTTIDLGRVVKLMGSGVAAVMDGYLSLFGMSL